MTEAAKELNIHPTICALRGGEDYELLFTAPPKLKTKLESIKHIQLIGQITQDSEKIELITKLNESIDIMSDGWESFAQGR